jgi:membrane protein implicated in regulation of membrane protease activity
MEELLQIAFAPANFILTLLLIIVMLYWLIVIFTGFDFDLADADADFDVDASGDFSKPETGNVDGGSFWSEMLRFFYVGELPVIFIITLVVFSMWLINVNITAIFGISHNMLGFALYLPGFIVSMLITKVIARPFVKLYAMFNHKGEVPIDFIGKTGRVISPMHENRLGQIEIQVVKDVIKVYAKSIDGQPIQYNDTVIVLEESQDKKFFFVQKYQS